MKKLLIAFMVTVVVTPAFARVKLRAGGNRAVVVISYLIRGIILCYIFICLKAAIRI